MSTVAAPTIAHAAHREADRTVSAESPVHLSIIVPTLNGGERLQATLRDISTFAWRQPYAVERIIVDDGSDEATQRILSDWQREDPELRVVRNQQNSGKGYSVRRGMEAARGAYRVFLDADLAYPAREIAGLVEALTQGADVAIVCRTDVRSRYVMSPAYFHYLYTRHLMSRVFNGFVRLALLPGINDTQAGLKGFTAQAAARVFSQVTVPRFGFDLEVLFIAQRMGLRVLQLPVEFRYDNEPSTVHFMRDACTMLRDIAVVRWRGWLGRYG